AILETCAQFRPDVIVTTGSAPISARTLRSCRQKGVKCVNFSTDDPFNPRHRAPWLLRALRDYDVVFTPRTANQEELSRHGCQRAAYLPFGYYDALFFAETKVDVNEGSSLFFAGIRCEERAPYIQAAREAGLGLR